MTEVETILGKSHMIEREEGFPDVTLIQEDQT